jgi:hypothetical protein
MIRWTVCLRSDAAVECVSHDETVDLVFCKSCSSLMNASSRLTIPKRIVRSKGAREWMTLCVLLLCFQPTDDPETDC